MCPSLSFGLVHCSLIGFLENINIVFYKEIVLIKKSIKDPVLMPHFVGGKRWEDNIKDWTGMDYASSTRAVETG